ncbi:MAG: metallophosphoesterase, partial [Bryobacteraceae bacterium]|nr:metallophosphoesterase [Bryobacteraceae bacterium]
AMSNSIDRRSFLAGAGLAVAGPGGTAQTAPSTVQFGLIADVHHGLMPDAHHRLDSFLAEVNRRSPDFIMQLGDFCHPKPESRAFLRSWHSFRGPKHNVLGNHDMDHGTKSQIMELWEMPKNYYSFDLCGFHFIVLDCNYLNMPGGYVDFANSNYFGTGWRRDWVNPEQLEWLRADLRAAALPTIVFTHQCVGPFWAKDAHVNRSAVKAILTATNEESGWQKVVACFSGHHHTDHHAELAGVNYLLVNSASYYWVGEEYGSLAKYRSPLFTFVTLNPSGQIRIEGRRSEFLAPTPTELHHPDAAHVTASIQERQIRFQPRTKRSG